jgi:hypothetical protein
MKQDVITFTILEDGTIRTETDGVSAMNHASADKFVKGIDGLLAGKVDVKRKTHAHAHTHAGQTHTHKA